MMMTILATIIMTLVVVIRPTTGSLLLAYTGHYKSIKKHGLHINLPIDRFKPLKIELSTQGMTWNEGHVPTESPVSPTEYEQYYQLITAGKPQSMVNC